MINISIPHGGIHLVLGTLHSMDFPGFMAETDIGKSRGLRRVRLKVAIQLLHHSP